MESRCKVCDVQCAHLSPLGLPASLSLLAQASSKDCVRYRRGLLRAMPRGPTTPPSVARRDFGLPRNRLLFPNPAHGVASSC